MAKAVKAAVVVGLVATGIGALTGAVAGGSAFSLFGTTLAKGSLSAFFATQFTTSLVLGAVSQALAKNASSAVSSGNTITGKNPLSPLQVIYGRTRVGGSIVYMEGTDSNKYLHIVAAIAGHEIDGIEKFYFNDKEVTIDGSGNVSTGTYANKARIKFKLGTDDQTAFSDLVAESDSLWTENHRLRGRAVVYIRLEYDQDVYPTGMPNFSFLVRGKKVFDPRSSTTAWSANPALCLNDYLTNSRYGLGCVYANEIDQSALIASANVCDEDVTLDAGGTENKYELHGSLVTSGTPEDIINQMLTSMAGKAVWTGGKWRILAGAYYTPTLTFDEDDLRSGFTVQTLVSRRENFNCVKGVFVSAQDNYISTDFPSLVSNTFIAQDSGEAVYKNITLPFTTSVTMAQRLSKIELLKARQQITLSLPLRLQGLKASVGDIVYVNNTRLGWSSKPFEVVAMSMSLDEAPGVDLDLREISTDVFSWLTSEEQAYDPAPNTNLPSAFQVGAPTDLTITGTNLISPDGTVQSGLLVTWTPPINSFVVQYEVQYIRGASNFDWGQIDENATSSVNYGLITSSADSSADYGSITDSTTSAETNYNSVFVTTPYYVISPAIAGVEYAVRVRAINTLGVRSAFVTSNQTTYGDTTAPNPPSQVLALGDYKQIVVSWLNPTVSDFDYVEVYRNTVNNPGTSTKVAVLRGTTYVDAPLGINITRYYWLKSVDRTGNVSDFTSVVSATTEFVDSDSFSQEVMNLFQEAGAYGIEPVATLPPTGDFDGQIKYDTTTNKLYRWDATNSVWTDDIFSITSGSVDEASFAAGIEPVKIVTELPNPSGYTGSKVVFLTTDNKLYRYTGTAWSSSVAAADIAGTIGADNFSQSLRPVEVVSALPSSGNFQGRTVVLTSDSKIYRYTGTAWTASVPTADLSGTISAGQIAAGAITAGKIAADAVTAGTIAAGAVGVDQLAANSVTAGKIAAAAVSADKIAANAITADKIQAGAIQTDKIAANAITGGLIAAAGVITSAAQINDAVITNVKIQNGAITTAKIGDAQITGAKIGDAEIDTLKVAGNAITAVQGGDVAGSYQGGGAGAFTITATYPSFTTSANGSGRLLINQSKSSTVWDAGYMTNWAIAFYAGNGAHTIAFQKSVNGGEWTNIRVTTASEGVSWGAIVDSVSPGSTVQYRWYISSPSPYSYDVGAIQNFTYSITELKR
jgi:hypothetical protein